MPSKRILNWMGNWIKRVGTHIESRLLESKHPAHRRVIKGDALNKQLAWQDVSIPEKQRQLVEFELRAMYAGNPALPYTSLAKACTLTERLDGSFVEIGCSSGYYSEVLKHLLNRKINYTGVDYSPAFIALAKKLYPFIPFLVADTTALPLADNSFDVVLAAGVIQFVADYSTAIRESARVAKAWCIFHRVPVLQSAETILLAKPAYGVETLTIRFNEAALLAEFQAAGLSLQQELLIDAAYDADLKETLSSKTYMCRKT
jgi:SAM-dependent methyltransferase